MHPLHRRQMPQRVLGLLAFLAWLGVAWTFWQVQFVRPRQTIPLDLPMHRFLRVDAGHPMAVINPRQDELAFLNAATGEKRTVLKGNMRQVFGVVAARNQKTLVTVYKAGRPTIWQTAEEGNTRAFWLPWHEMNIEGGALVCSPDGKMVAIDINEGGTTRARLWDVATQKEIATFDGHLGTGSGIAGFDNFLPDSQTLATVTLQGVKLWDLATQRPRHTLVGTFSLIAITPDGKTLATYDPINNRVALWDPATAQKRSSFPAPAGVGMMFVSPDGSKVWLRWRHRYSSADHLFRSLRVPAYSLSPPDEETAVFDAATGQECARIPCDRMHVFFADDKTLATLSEEKEAIELWDLPPRRAVPPMLAWACLASALILTGTCWRAPRVRQKVKMEILESREASPH